MNEINFEENLVHHYYDDMESVYLYCENKKVFIKDLIEEYIGTPEFEKPIGIIITAKDGEITIKRK